MVLLKKTNLTKIILMNILGREEDSGSRIITHCSGDACDTYS